MNLVRKVGVQNVRVEHARGLKLADVGRRVELDHVERLLEGDRLGLPSQQHHHHLPYPVSAWLGEVTTHERSQITMGIFYNLISSFFNYIDQI